MATTLIGAFPRWAVQLFSATQLRSCTKTLWGLFLAGWGSIPAIPLSVRISSHAPYARHDEAV